ncbi:MAG TPA: hypothetical protein VF875_15080 [Anaeromyxobacter sp.]
MRARHALAAALVAALAAIALRPVAFVRIENERRARTWRFPVRPGEPFTVTSHHSMYDEPVTEEFVVGARDEIVLRAVSSPSAAVREYFGLTGPGERQPVVRAMPRVVFRIAAGEPQWLRVGGEERSFLDLGDHGDRLVLAAGRAPALARWLDLLRRSP